MGIKYVHLREELGLTAGFFRPGCMTNLLRQIHKLDCVCCETTLLGKKNKPKNFSFVKSSVLQFSKKGFETLLCLFCFYCFFVSIVVRLCSIILKHKTLFLLALGRFLSICLLYVARTCFGIPEMLVGLADSKGC